MAKPVHPYQETQTTSNQSRNKSQRSASREAKTLPLNLSAKSIEIAGNATVVEGKQTEEIVSKINGGEIAVKYKNFLLNKQQVAGIC